MSSFNLLSTKKLKAALVEQLKLNGFRVTETEFIRIESAASESEIEKFIESIEEDAYVVFTSSNAVDAIPKSAENATWKVFCISGKTREAVLDKLKLSVVVATANSGAELAKGVIRHAKEVVFFSGDIRREELPRILLEAGVKLREFVVYRTLATPVAIEEDVDGILFFSPSAVKSFFSMNKLSLHSTCFAIGNTTAEEIKQFTDNKVVVAENPTQESLISAVNQFYKSTVQQ